MSGKLKSLGKIPTSSFIGPVPLGKSGSDNDALDLPIA